MLPWESNEIKTNGVREVKNADTDYKYLPHGLFALFAGFNGCSAAHDDGNGGEGVCVLQEV